jgi:hypothetical protein
MAIGIELERVRRTTGGRVHLVPHVPDSGSVETLCGQTLAESTYASSDLEADCRNCLRRRDDPGRVSSAFFQSDVGAELLQRSLDQARARPRDARPERPARPVEPAASREPPPVPRPSVVPRPEPEPPQIRELRSRVPLRPTFPDVYLSPEGVIVRVADGAVSHVSFNGSIDLRQRDGVLTVRAGDVVLEFDTR